MNDTGFALIIGMCIGAMITMFIVGVFVAGRESLEENINTLCDLPLQVERDVIYCK